MCVCVCVCWVGEGGGGEKKGEVGEERDFPWSETGDMACRTQASMSNGLPHTG